MDGVGHQLAENQGAGARPHLAPALGWRGAGTIVPVVPEAVAAQLEDVAPDAACKPGRWREARLPSHVGVLRHGRWACSPASAQSGAKPPLGAPPSRLLFRGQARLAGVPGRRRGARRPWCGPIRPGVPLRFQ